MNVIVIEVDVFWIENQGLFVDFLVSIYEMIGCGVVIDLSVLVLLFFLCVDDYCKLLCWIYVVFLWDIICVVNMFLCFGIDCYVVVVFVLLNLLEMYFVIWGGEVVGIVCVINLLLEGLVIVLLFKVVNVKVLVMLVFFLGMDIWLKIQFVLSEVLLL